MKVTSLSELLNIRQELALQKTCHHSNIMTVGDCFNWKDKLWIVMEYMDRGSLAEIVSTEYPMPEPHIAYVCRCLLLALDALHSQNRIHRGTL